MTITNNPSIPEDSQPTGPITINTNGNSIFLKDPRVIGAIIAVLGIGGGTGIISTDAIGFQKHISDYEHVVYRLSHVESEQEALRRTLNRIDKNVLKLCYENGIECKDEY